MVNAVSLRLFSIAIAWSVSSGSQASSGMTAALLPVKGRSAKASTWTKRNSVIRFLSGLPLDGGGWWGWGLHPRRIYLLCHPAPNPSPSRGGALLRDRLLGFVGFQQG